jgi:hypothetical protein
MPRPSFSDAPAQPLLEDEGKRSALTFDDIKKIALVSPKLKDRTSSWRQAS